MKALPFTVIKSDKQYYEYCNTLIAILEKRNVTTLISVEEDIIELLTLLIEKHDDDTRPWPTLTPVEYLELYMKDSRLKAADLARELGVSKSIISDILHYRRGFSKDLIRRIAKRFNARQDVFNKPYRLDSTAYVNLKKKRATAKKTGNTKNKQPEAVKSKSPSKTSITKKKTVKKDKKINALANKQTGKNGTLQNVGIKKGAARIISAKNIVLKNGASVNSSKNGTSKNPSSENGASKIISAKNASSKNGTSGASSKQVVPTNAPAKKRKALKPAYAH